jgi:major type 1 subunit fimbrin (pilin)
MMTHAIRQLAIPALLCTLGTLCANAHAASGTITFNGSVISETCAPTMSAVGAIQGKQDFTVTLPSVSAADLKTNGAAAGAVGFSVSVSDCSSATGKVTTFFEGGPAVDMQSGRLNNMTPAQSGGARNVQIELLNASDNSAIRAGADKNSQNAQWVSLTPTTPGAAKPVGKATMNYIARYRANGGEVTSGLVTSKVTYSMIWQ